VGPVSKNRGRDTSTLELFGPPEVQDSIVRLDTMLKPIDRPVWSENKARLIQKYVRYFIMVTRHGAYIDAFSGPQEEKFNNDSWSAKLVLEIKPAWLTRFVLCELKTDQVDLLDSLIAARRRVGDNRSIELHQGDCNITLPEALRHKPIKSKQATFCLLDQRAFECNWQTVRHIASHKISGNKIEM
jgi:three-Cys-motif partner protein